MKKTEFYETAVQQGFYGLEQASLFGKKDNVRKYWEDIFIKIFLRPIISEILLEKEKIRVVDLGSGSGEGLELITHIPFDTLQKNRNFILSKDEIDFYFGLDISPSMVNQGNENYKQYNNIKFIQDDLSKEYFFLDEKPFDLYLSTYSSPSHLSRIELENLLSQILVHNQNSFFIYLDVLGKYSPEWPNYWEKNNDELQLYNMSWLKPQSKEKIENFYMRFWSAQELKDVINKIASKHNRNVNVKFKDRSIFVGRHIDTGYFNEFPLPIRYQVNQLFERDYEGELDKLKLDFPFLSQYKQVLPIIFNRIELYHIQWIKVIEFVEALQNNNKEKIKFMIENEPPELSEEFKMFAWLYNNSSRFPVVDFWASIMGPQIGCVLRNLEYSLQEGLGCGHGLMVLIKVE